MKYRIVLLMIILLNPLVVNAKNNTDYISFDCKREKDKTICEVYGNTNMNAKAIDFKYSLPKSVKSNTFTLVEGSYGSTKDNWVSVAFSKVLTDKFKIGSLVVTSKKNVSDKDIKISDLIIIDDNYEEHIIEDNQESNNFIYIIVLVVVLFSTLLTFIIIKRGVFKK